MRITAILSLVGGLAAFSTTAAAQDIDEDIDTNGDGQYAFEELAQLHPDLTEEVFASFDADGDGYLDAGEYEVALEDEVLAPDLDQED